MSKVNGLRVVHAFHFITLLHNVARFTHAPGTHIRQKVIIEVLSNCTFHHKRSVCAIIAVLSFTEMFQFDLTNMHSQFIRCRRKCLHTLHKQMIYDGKISLIHHHHRHQHYHPARGCTILMYFVFFLSLSFSLSHCPLICNNIGCFCVLFLRNPFKF